MNRQRIVAMSAGTGVFWVVDPESQTVHVTDLSGTKLYAAGGVIPLTIPCQGAIAVDQIFAV